MTLKLIESVLLAVLIILLLSASSSASTLSSNIGIAAGGDLTYLDQQNLDNYFQNLTQLGVTWVRWDIEWRTIEKERGTYNWETSDKVAKTAQKYGIKSLIIIHLPPEWAIQEGLYNENRQSPPKDFEDFAYFAKQVAIRYKESTYGPIEYFEIWNEPNLEGGWYPASNAESYTELLKLSYTAIKEANPDATVISGGLAMAVTKDNNISPVDFINSLYDAGAKGYFDAIALHPYTYPAAPNSEIEWNGWKSIDSIREIMVKNGDSDKKIWITEYGAPTYGPGSKFEIITEGVFNYGSDYMSEESQEEMFRQAIEFYNKKEFLGAFFPFNLFDKKISNTEKLNTEYYFGLIHDNGTKKTAYWVIKQALNTTSPAVSVSYTPKYDNQLRESSPNTVLSTTTYLDVGKSTSFSRDVVFFDLSAYKITDRISKATLALYWYYPAGKTRTSDTVVEVYRPVEWDPKYVTWNNRASGTPWTNAGGNWLDKNGVSQGTTPYASLTFLARKVPDNKYYEFDVTQLVQEYVSGKYKNTGFFLKAKTESGNYIAFYSSEVSNAAQKPKLTITKGSAAVDNPPITNAGADKTTTVGTAVTFDASASTDDKGIASYSWDFDQSNGITADATTKIASKTYTTAGTYTVTLTVTDTAGQKSTDTLKVVVSNTPSSASYTPTCDNRLRDSSPTTVLSTTTYLDVGRSTSRSRDVLLFDLSAYKTTDTISTAILSLYWYYPAAATRTSDTIVEVYRPVEWDPKYVTWNNRASGTPWTNAGGNWFDKNGVSQGTTPYASVTFSASKVPDNKYYEFDVTQLVKEYVSGKYKNTGFFIKAKTESGNYIAFYSSEASNAAQKPKLTITR